MTEGRDFAAEQSAFWNGAGGKGWLAAYGRIERSARLFNEDVIAAAGAQPGEHVVDVGCGTGATTAELARRVAPLGLVTGVDISEALIAAARAQEAPRTAFEVGDATDFPFASAAFDLVFSRYGVMFFADPVRAFSNLRRALKRSGRLVFLCWRTPQENPWGRIPMMAAAPHLPPMQLPGPEEPGQYSFGDRARVTRILEGAGFGALSFEAVDHPMFIGQDVADALTNVTQFGPLARPFAESTPEQAAKAKDAIAAAVKPYETRDGVLLPGACWIVKGKPH